MSGLATPTEYEWEPIRGLPARPPANETVLWQGSPHWQSLAVRAFHVRKVAIYFGVLLAWRAAAAHADGEALGSAATALLLLAGLATAAVVVLALLAWLYARTTVFTVTSRRVVMRFGVALPMALNIPFRIVEAAGVKLHADGTGDIPLRLTGPDRASYLHLWPFARAWRVARPEPCLRCVPDGARAAEILGRALQAATGGPSRAPVHPEALDKPARPLAPVAA